MHCYVVIVKTVEMTSWMIEVSAQGAGGAWGM